LTQAKVGVIHGRFQPLHLGHMEYLLQGAERCKYLYVGITNPDPGSTKSNKTDLNRSKVTANPLTYWERAVLLRRGLSEAGITEDRFCIIPFPINTPEYLKFYAPKEARYYVTIYDQWGRHKKEILESLGLDVEVMWERNLSEKITSGTKIREAILHDRNWSSFVPRVVFDIMKEHRWDNKIRLIMKSG